MLAHVPERDLHPPEFHLYVLPQRGEAAVFAVAIDQWPAELLLQTANGPGQARLRNAAQPCRGCEIERLSQIDEVADLIEFHSSSARPMSTTKTASNFAGLLLLALRLIGWLAFGGSDQLSPAL